MTYENDILTAYQTVGYDEYSRTLTSTEKAGDNKVSGYYEYNDNNGLTTKVTQSYRAGVKSATNTFAYSYDHLKRLSSTAVTHDNTSYTVGYSYANNLSDSTYTSNLVSRKSYGTSVHTSNAYKFEYVYDNAGNIKTATGTSEYSDIFTSTVRYGYDEQNQLVSERCAVRNRAYVYEYDTYGNIRSKKTYTYGNYADPEDIAANCTLLDTESYTYDDYEWADLLTAYNGIYFSHDIIGNPLTYYNGSNYSFTWQNGRQLASADCDGLEIAYEYDIDGLRTKKAIQNGETYYYYYSGGKLISMVWNNGENSLNFLYDGSGNPYSFVYRFEEDGEPFSSSYYYVTNLQGDVIAILNAQHGVVAEYTYDAWGNILSVTDGSGNNLFFSDGHIGNLNPLRYRGYVYDTETGFYYLQSRYYDPAVGRFINGDGLLIQSSFLGYNQFAYCMNNGLMLSDSNGEAPDEFWIMRAKQLIKKNFSKKFGKGHNVPYYMSPAEDFDDPSDYSTYTCVGRATFTKNFTSKEINEILHNSETNYIANAGFDAIGFVASSFIATPSSTALAVYEWIDFSSFVTSGVKDYIHQENLNVVDCDYTATVAIYRNPEGKYAVANKITSNSNSSYNCGWMLSYNYDSKNSLQYYAFPDSIGVRN